MENCFIAQFKTVCRTQQQQKQQHKQKQQQQGSIDRLNNKDMAPCFTAQYEEHADHNNNHNSL